MHSHDDKDARKKSNAVSNSIKNNKTSASFQFKDNRKKAHLQQNLQNGLQDNTRIKQLSSYQKMANNFVAQQYKKTAEPLQNNSKTIQKKENSNGLPSKLQSGLESLSGYSMENVKVHYNSPKPAQMQAHAYAQGTNIHLASGQEKHLPHEAWHVVQQMQGRVNPTTKINGVNVNDNVSLEREADRMGDKAATLQLKTEQKNTSLKTQTIPIQNKLENTVAKKEEIVQRKKYKNTRNGKVYNVVIGNNKIEAQEIDGESYGYITFRIDQHDATLLHIESHPKVGSGLGAMLVFFFALQVAQKSIPFIFVAAPATTAQGFYAKMGFNVEAAKEEVRKKYRAAGRADDIVEPVTVSEVGGLTTFVSMHASQSFFRNWASADPIQAAAPAKKKSILSKIFK